jgi:hypothetical protein
MYFEKFPITFYSLDDRESVQLIKNIFLRAGINSEVKNNYSAYDEYDILDGETPEILADKYYGNSQYHWVILHMNDILDPRFDWPLTTNNLVKYCQSKYTNIYDTHHYEDSNGFWVNSDVPGAVSVSNFTYEELLNEKKRRIKMLKPQFIENVAREFISKIESING